MDNNHKYGIDLEADLIATFGDNYKEIDRQRGELWQRLTQKGVPLFIKAIIQNPIPISKDYYNEWLEVLKANEDDISKNGIKIIEEVKGFVIKYQLR